MDRQFHSRTVVPHLVKSRSSHRAAKLDRDADLMVNAGLHTQAEALSHRAEELRGAAKEQDEPA